MLRIRVQSNNTTILRRNFYEIWQKINCGLYSRHCFYLYATPYKAVAPNVLIHPNHEHDA